MRQWMGLCGCAAAAIATACLLVRIPFVAWSINEMSFLLAWPAASPTSARLLQFVLADAARIRSYITMACVGMLSVAIFYTLQVFALRRRRVHDGLTRCGSCGYILKGLSEPRCPECGQRL